MLFTMRAADIETLPLGCVSSEFNPDRKCSVRRDIIGNEQTIRTERCRKICNGNSGTFLEHPNALGDREVMGRGPKMILRLNTKENATVFGRAYCQINVFQM